MKLASIFRFTALFAALGSGTALAGPGDFWKIRNAFENLPPPSAEDLRPRTRWICQLETPNVNDTYDYGGYTVSFERAGGGIREGAGDRQGYAGHAYRTVEGEFFASYVHWGDGENAYEAYRYDAATESLLGEISVEYGQGGFVSSRARLPVHTTALWYSICRHD